MCCYSNFCSKVGESYVWLRGAIAVVVALVLVMMAVIVDFTCICFYLVLLGVFKWTLIKSQKRRAYASYYVNVMAAGSRATESVDGGIQYPGEASTGPGETQSQWGARTQPILQEI